jgi:hypothetical protein
VRKLQLLSALFCVASTTFTVAAQTPPLLLSVARVQVKPDRVGEFMDVEKQYSAAFKKGGGTIRVVYRNAAGNPFEFLVIAVIPNYGPSTTSHFTPRA